MPEITVGLVRGERRGRPGPPHRWHGPHRWTQWVIDWCGYSGQRTQVLLPSGPLPPAARPACSWHVYAPGIGYSHSDLQQPSHCDHLWFFFDLRRSWAPLEGRPFTVLLDEEERLGPHVLAMAELHQHGERGHELAIQGHALVVLGELLLASQRGGDGSSERPWRVSAGQARADSLQRRIEREVLRDLRSPPTLAGIAERLGMSVSSLCHRYQAETGLSVMQRVRWLRIREVRRLLAQPEATVKSVARQAGYSSAFHLSSQFRRLTGLTPSEFQRRQRR